MLLTKNARFSPWLLAQTVGVMRSVLLVALAGMLAACRLNRLIGDSGASMISRVMGLILASVATASVLAGIKVYFSLQGARLGPPDTCAGP